MVSAHEYLLGIKANGKYPWGRNVKGIFALVHIFSPLQLCSPSLQVHLVSTWLAFSPLHFRVLSLVGLSLIALGTGGIKPCVAAFGGDQFEEKHAEERTRYFSVFYLSINAGSLISTFITPMLRGDVQCFGEDCYALAFGVPGLLMVIALVCYFQSFQEPFWRHSKATALARLGS